MTYQEYKDYVKAQNPSISEEDVAFLFDSCEVVYLNYTSPFDKEAIFDETNKRATNWVTRAVQKILDNGEINIKSYSENGLSISIDITLINELVPKVGVPNDEIME